VVWVVVWVVISQEENSPFAASTAAAFNAATALAHFAVSTVTMKSRKQVNADFNVSSPE
jgi:hypothetical protein